MSKSNDGIDQEPSYKTKVFKSLNRINLRLRPSFTKALNPHKFNLEIFIPKTMKINKVISDKNFLRNRLIKFNNRFNSKKKYFERLREQTRSFSEGYKKIKVLNERKNKENEYIEKINEIYKLKGYDVKNDFFTKRENTFQPSFLLSGDKKYNLICDIESKIEQKREIKYLERFSKFLRERKNNSAEEELKTKDNQKLYFNLDNQDYKKAIDEMKRKVFEELKIKNMSAKELKRLNYQLIQENKMTEYLIKEAENDNNKLKKKNLVVIDDIFLSSKGMIRSAKKREEDNNSYDDFIKIEDKTRDDILYSNNILTKRERRINFQRRKEKQLQKVYNNIIKTNYMVQEGEVKGFLKRYTERKVENPNSRYGSNLHGFLGEFQKKISLNDIPNFANEVNITKRENYRRNMQQNNNINSNSANYTLIDVDNIYDVNEEINNLGYKYTEDLLKLK